jgi:hypothetical protein
LWQHGCADKEIHQLAQATDHITRAIHAFAHFSVVYSRKNNIFCDLQGSVPPSKFYVISDEMNG